MCKQAEPGFPNLKAGATPDPGVTKRSVGAQPAHVRKWHNCCPLGKVHASQRQQDGDITGCFWVCLEGTGEESQQLPTTTHIRAAGNHQR